MLGDDKIKELQARNSRLTRENKQFGLMIQALQAELDESVNKVKALEHLVWTNDNKDSRRIHKLMVENRGLRERIDHYQNIVDIKDQIIDKIMKATEPDDEEVVVDE